MSNKEGKSDTPEKKETPKLPKNFPKKIIVDTLPPRSGSCIFHNFMYGALAALCAVYMFFVIDKATFQHYSEKFTYLGYLQQAFVLVDEYSPFHQFIQSDEEFIESMKKKGKRNSMAIFTKAELATYDGSDGSPGLYLAILGQVYDVETGKEYYAPGNGYHFFVGKDGARAFVSGQFDDAGLTDDVTGMTHGDYLGLKEWVEFYETDYKRVGVLVGRYFTSNGEVTEEWKTLQANISAAIQDRENKDVEKQVFPPCNIEWSKENGHRVWCTKKSGGIIRNWSGLPRRLFYPGRSERCACVRATGAPSTDPTAKSNHGDLMNPHLKEYENCPTTNDDCYVKVDD